MKFVMKNDWTAAYHGSLFPFFFAKGNHGWGPGGVFDQHAKYNDPKGKLFFGPPPSRDGIRQDFRPEATTVRFSPGASVISVTALREG